MSKRTRKKSRDILRSPDPPAIGAQRPRNFKKKKTKQTCGKRVQCRTRKKMRVKKGVPEGDHLHSDAKPRVEKSMFNGAEGGEKGQTKTSPPNSKKKCIIDRTPSSRKEKE